MSFELEKEKVIVYEPLKAVNIKTVTNADIIVPDVKPDILRVLEVYAIASIREKYIQKDKMCISGTISYTVLYTGDTENSEVRSIRYKMPFSEQIELIGARENMSYFAQCEVTHIEHRIENSRKINVRSVLSFNCGAASRKEVFTVSNICGEQEIPVKGTEIKALDMVVCSQNTFSVNDRFKIPETNSDIGEILKMDVKICKNEQKIMNGKLVVKGSILCDILYTIDGDIYHMENESPYTEVLDADDISPEMHTEISYQLESADFEYIESDSENAVNVSVDVGVITKAFIENRYRIISDTYCPDYKITLTEEINSVYSVDDSFSEVYSFCEALSVGENDPGIVKIYNLTATPIINDVTLENGFIKHEGHMDVKILYSSDSDNRPVCSLNKQIPFSMRVSTDNASEFSQADSSVMLEHVSYVLKSDKMIEIRATLNFEGKITHSEKINFINDISISDETPLPKKNQAGITIYFADKGEALWDIAKRYNTTEAEIASINSISVGDIMTHRQQLLIPKRVII